MRNPILQFDGVVWRPYLHSYTAEQTVSQYLHCFEVTGSIFHPLIREWHRMWWYASYHHIPSGTQLSTIKHTQSSKLDQLNAQQPVHYKITPLDSAISLVVVCEVGHSRDNDVQCAAGYEICTGLFWNGQRAIFFTGMLGFEPGVTRIKIWSLIVCIIQSMH